MKNLDTIRAWIANQPASIPVRKLRLHLFDLYRYAEDYDKIYELVNDLKGE